MSATMFFYIICTIGFLSAAYHFWILFSHNWRMDEISSYDNNEIQKDLPRLPEQFITSPQNPNLADTIPIDAADESDKQNEADKQLVIKQVNQQAKNQNASKINFDNASNTKIEQHNFRIFSLNHSEGDSESTNSEIQINTRVKPYFTALKNSVSSIKHSVLVLDYFEHSRAMEQKGTFYDTIKTKYSDYFSQIEKIILKNDKIQYIRVLQLPLLLGFQYTPEAEEAMIKEALKTLYTPTFEHIKRIIHLPNFKLYVAPRAVRTNSEIVVDKNKWVIELDRYDKELRARPDRLIIGKAGSSQQMKRVIDDEYELIMKLTKSCILITEPAIIYAHYMRSKVNLVVNTKQEDAVNH